MKIPELMNSVSEVLTTAEELIEEGEDVGPMLASFLKTLLVDLDKVLVSEGPTGVRPQRAQPVDPASPRDPSWYQHNSAVPGGRGGRTSKRTKRPIVNKYDGECAYCKTKVAAGEGVVVANDNPDAKKKWTTFCQTHTPKLKEAT